jgi:hypothetical protein
MSDLLALTKLRANRLLRTPTEAAAFESALASLAEVPDHALLPELHLILDDECHDHELMFGLVHFLESFDIEVQLSALFDVLPQLVQQAPEWSRVIHFRILNDVSARKCYQQMLSRLGGPSLASARAILDDIAKQEDEPLKSAAESVLAAN